MNLLNMIKFELKMMFKTPIMILSYFIYPLLLTLIIGYLAQDSFGGDVSSYEYYSTGMMLFIYSGAGLASAYNFIDKPIKEGNLRIIFTPIKTMNIYLSQILSGTIFSSIGVAITMLLFQTLGIVNYNGNELIIFLSFVTLSFLSSALGIFLCTVIDDSGVINMIFNMIQAILCMLGGAFFSFESLGSVQAFIAKLSPIKWILDGLLNSIYDNNNFLLYVIVAVNIVLGVLLVSICKATFKTEKYI